jgi:hypothetical protein
MLSASLLSGKGFLNFALFQTLPKADGVWHATRARRTIVMHPESTRPQ